MTVVFTEDSIEDLSIWPGEDSYSTFFVFYPVADICFTVGFFVGAVTVTFAGLDLATVARAVDLVD